MKVVRLHAARDLRLHDEPKPEPGPHETLVRVVSGGICGSDLHWYSEGSIGSATLVQPLVLGHEFSGVIESGSQRGQRVVIEPSDACGVCEQCHAGHPNLCQKGRFAGYATTDGSFREFAVWPEHLLISLPDGISDTEAAMLEPLCNALQAIDLGHVRAGMTVAVYGAGPIGLSILQAAKAAGATQLFATEKLAHRLEAAHKLGATDVFVADGSEAEAVMKATGGRGVDVAFEAAGSQDAIDVAVATARPGGRVILVGVPVEQTVHFNFAQSRGKGLTIAVQRRSHPEYPRAMRLVQSGLVDVASIVSHEFPLTEAKKAFEFAEERKGLKVLITA